jgi:Leucine-rich repeat (LRR) protein
MLIKIPATIGRLSRLHTLDISHNRIQTIPSEIFDLKELIVFDFSHNKITEIPQYLTLMLKLEKITAHHNPVTGIPKGSFFFLSHSSESGIKLTFLEILTMGDRNLCAYMKNLMSGEETIFRTKLMILGHHEVGKSSLVK